MNTTVEGFTTSTAQDVGHNLCALRVPGEDELRFRASLGVGGQLGEARNDSVVGGLARQIGVEGRVDEILVTTAGETVAGRRHEIPLSSRVRFVVAASQEEVHVFARSARLSQRHGSSR